MALLEKIRVKFGLVISIIIALALLSFIIDPSTLESALNSMSSKYDVGKVAGKKVSYTDFQETVDKYTTINELLQGSSAQNEQIQQQIRNAAWQEYLDKYMFVENAKKAGITVGEEELVSLVSGSNPSPIIAQNPVFMDESGVFSPDALKSFLDAMASDETGRLRLYWDYVQNTVYTQQFYQKYGALFSASSFENALQLASDLEAGNTTVNIDYCMSYYPMGQDSTINVSSSEIKKFYKDHKSFFKRNASREVEYVVFEVVPSSYYVNKTSLEMDEAYEMFATTDNMKSFLQKNSESQLSSYWYKEGELSTINSELDDQIFAQKRNLTQVIKSGNTFYAGRVVAEKNIPDSVFVKHILLQGSGAKNTADSLVKVLSKGGVSFSNLAAQYSLDQNSAYDGELGTIGWMTQNYMIPGMESVLEAQVGKPFSLTSSYGTHVVLVTRASKAIAKKQVAVLEKTAIASKETFNSYYAQANTFASLTAGSYEGYKKAVDSTKVYSHSLTITEATSNYGSIDQAKTVTRWAFDHKPGKASEILTVNNNYFFIVAVKEAHKEGYAPVSEVAEVIKNRLYSEKLQQKTLASVSEKIEGLNDMEKIAEALSVSVENNEALSLASASVDPALAGAASVAPQGAVYGPVAGNMGVYVVKVNSSEKGSFYTEDDARSTAAQKAQYTSQLIIPVMSEYCDVKDNRERFY